VYLKVNTISGDFVPNKKCKDYIMMSYYGCFEVMYSYEKNNESLGIIFLDLSNYMVEK